jgi:diadenylate cyclase
MLLFIKIGFLEITFWDIADILIVGYLLYQLFRLIKGSIAVNILAGITMLYITWWLVAWLKMDALSMILGQFARLGLIALVIVFQPEMRRFLLLIGQTLNMRIKSMRRLVISPTEVSEESRDAIAHIVKTLPLLAEQRIGALFVFTTNTELQLFAQSGVRLDANLSTQILMSIFNTESPLHDGAVIIGNNKIFAASCVLPVTESSALPEHVGTRHRAAVGITEVTDGIAVVVSEETGKISYARDGNLNYDLSAEQIGKILLRVFQHNQ